ncbi:MAG: hypothetical protein ACC628_23340, partial [Pirellulaceae bacterium]
MKDFQRPKAANTSTTRKRVGAEAGGETHLLARRACILRAKILRGAAPAPPWPEENVLEVASCLHDFR